MQSLYMQLKSLGVLQLQSGCCPYGGKPIQCP